MLMACCFFLASCVCGAYCFRALYFQWRCSTGVDTAHLNLGWEPISLVKVRDASTCPTLPPREASRNRCAFWGKTKKQLCSLLHPISWLSSTLRRQPLSPLWPLPCFLARWTKVGSLSTSHYGGLKEAELRSSVPLVDGDMKLVAKSSRNKSTPQEKGLKQPMP